MAELLATRASRGHRTLCLPFAEDFYSRIIDDPAAFRRAIDEQFEALPELFPHASPTAIASRTSESPSSKASRSDVWSSRMGPLTASGPRSSCPT